ncbi:hypothetical protein BBK14_08520 [Parafrankia soli]|uniref:Uncharacterized protein n=1 Tax=Parafrankia soli TaxID=2599596 RepID=A0A1S1PGD4_9ACTN|nr:hypothetical protein [Parafrankia soli]OHV20267.1 hypothetical protein BBK14_08520 [Parafrankia soli]
MTPAAALRMVLVATLMPGASQEEVLATLFGDLAGVPWRVPFQVPTSAVAGRAGPRGRRAAAAARAGRGGWRA